jgi:hypothetical protein
MTYYRFCCPTCDSFDIFPQSGSDAFRLWWVFGLLTCGDCGAQCCQAKCVEVVK